MEIRHARAATRHRISRRRSAYVARHPQATIVQPAPADSRHKDERIVYLGADEDGVELEVMAVQTNEALVIIHAMAIRDRYLPYLEPKVKPEEGANDA